MLSREELINGYIQVSKSRKEAEDKVDNIMDLVDINKSGKVDFTG
jgi:calcium-dependent protein kinase